MRVSSIVEIGLSGGQAGRIRTWGDQGIGLLASAFGGAAASYADVFFARLSRLSDEGPIEATLPYPPRVIAVARVLESLHRELWQTQKRGHENFTLGAAVVAVEDDRVFFLQIGPSALVKISAEGAKLVAEASNAGPLLGAQAKSGIRVHNVRTASSDRLVLLSGELARSPDIGLFPHIFGTEDDAQRASLVIFNQLKSTDEDGAVCTMRFPGLSDVPPANEAAPVLPPESTLVHDPPPPTFGLVQEEEEAPRAPSNEFDFHSEVLRELSDFMSRFMERPVVEAPAEAPVSLLEAPPVDGARPPSGAFRTPLDSPIVPPVAPTEPEPPRVAISGSRAPSSRELSDAMQQIDRLLGPDPESPPAAAAGQDASVNGQARAASPIEPALVDPTPVDPAPVRTVAAPPSPPPAPRAEAVSAYAPPVAPPRAMEPERPVLELPPVLPPVALDVRPIPKPFVDPVPTAPSEPQPAASGVLDPFIDFADVSMSLNLKSLGLTEQAIAALSTSEKTNVDLDEVARVAEADLAATWEASTSAPDSTETPTVELAALDHAESPAAMAEGPGREREASEKADEDLEEEGNARPRSLRLHVLVASAVILALVATAWVFRGRLLGGEGTNAREKTAVEEGRGRSAEPSQAARRTAERESAPATGDAAAPSAAPAPGAIVSPSSTGGATLPTAGASLVLVHSRRFEGDHFLDSTGDSVFVDRKFVGVTPFQHPIEPGVHSVRVGANPRAAITQIVEVPADAARVVRADFGFEERLTLSATSPLEAGAGKPMVVSVRVTDTDNPRAEQVTCFYRLGRGGTFVPAPLSPSAAAEGMWTGALPGTEDPRTAIQYYFAALDIDEAEIYSELYSAARTNARAEPHVADAGR